MNIQMYGTVVDSIVDGPGLRFSVFVQGCSHRCKGCHNPESQPKNGGYTQTVDELLSEIAVNAHLTSVTLSGGEPFEQVPALIELTTALRETGYNIWVYSGYLYEDLIKGSVHPDAPQLLALCDVLVDGPFVQSLHSYDLMWRGSSNQRVIDLAKTKTAGRIVLWEPEVLSFDVPDSW